MAGTGFWGQQGEERSLWRSLGRCLFLRQLWNLCPPAGRRGRRGQPKCKPRVGHSAPRFLSERPPAAPPAMNMLSRDNSRRGLAAREAAVRALLAPSSRVLVPVAAVARLFSRCGRRGCRGGGALEAGREYIWPKWRGYIEMKSCGEEGMLKRAKMSQDASMDSLTGTCNAERARGPACTWIC